MPRAGWGDACLKFESWLLRCSIGQFEQSSFLHPEQARRIAAQDCDLLLAQIAKVAAREQSFLQGLRPVEMKA
jgi:hypothetical protein